MSKILVVVGAGLFLSACTSSPESYNRYNGRGAYKPKPVNSIALPKADNLEAKSTYANGVNLMTRKVGNFTISVGSDPNTAVSDTPFVFVRVLNSSNEVQTVLDTQFSVTPARGHSRLGPILSGEMQARFQQSAGNKGFREAMLATFVTAAATAASAYSSSKTTRTNSVHSSTTTTLDYGAGVQVGSQQINNARNNARLAQNKATQQYANFRSVVFKSQTLKPNESQSGYIYFDPVAKRYKSGSMDYKITFTPEDYRYCLYHGGDQPECKAKPMNFFFTHKKSF